MCVIQILAFLAYRDDKGQPWVLPVVRQAEKVMANDETLNKEYLPVLGLETFSLAATSMLLGSDSPALLESRVRIFHHNVITTIIWLLTPVERIF